IVSLIVSWVTCGLIAPGVQCGSGSACPSRWPMWHAPGAGIGAFLSLAANGPDAAPVLVAPVGDGPSATGTRQAAAPMSSADSVRARDNARWRQGAMDKIVTVKFAFRARWRPDSGNYPCCA